MAAPCFLYIGTYTSTDSVGVYGCRFDAATGTLSTPVPAAALPNPTFQVRHLRLPVLYSTSEGRDVGGRHDGAVNALVIDSATGALTPLNHQPAGGAGPCHLAVDPTGRWLVTAHYAGGSVAVFALEANGGIGAMTDLAQHHGRSVNPERQAGPHAHSATFSPDGRFVFVADLGLDKIMVYRLDGTRGRLRPSDPPWIATAPGSGPRHMAFHPDGQSAYAMHELGNTLTAFAYDAAHGTLRETQTLSSLPAGFAGGGSGADVHVAPSGRFVYASNRGHDSLAVFRLEAPGGAVVFAGCDPVAGHWPRNFLIHPSGAFLIVANERSDSVVPFRVDTATGRLSPAGPAVSVPRPVCVTRAGP